MKLVRYGEKGAEKPGLIDKSGQLRDLSAHVKDLTGEAYSPDSLKKLAALDPASLPAVSGKPRFGAPVTGISKFVAIGLNYSDHAEETGAAIPTEPIIFMKADTSLSGPNDAVEQPRGSTKLDWEVELGVVIGTRAQYVSEADALTTSPAIASCNDVSERDFQIERGGQWDQGQGLRHLRPGRALARHHRRDRATRRSSRMWLDVNGERRQTGYDQTMIFGVAKLRLLRQRSS